jgi:hypothetical protein
MSKLQAAMGERKAMEAKHLKDLEDAVAKHKAEMDRREQVKAQEVKRLQEAVQEKSKQLKVVELELARYKNKPGAPAARPAAAPPAAPPAARPAAGPPSQSQLGDDEEMATKVNAIPVDVARSAAARPAAPPANKQTGARPAVSITAAAPQKRPQGEDRTVVVATSNSLPKSDDDVDFTSIIDNLGE